MVCHAQPQSTKELIEAHTSGFFCIRFAPYVMYMPVLEKTDI